MHKPRAVGGVNAFLRLSICEMKVIKYEVKRVKGLFVGK